MRLLIKREHIKEVTALLRNHKVQHSPFTRYWNREIGARYSFDLLREADDAYMTFLVLSNKVELVQ